ncbi:MAG: PAS domain-containing sensor histidine kinase [Aquamicrobium sp.]|uniref:sensor histidine kinase n=1 Tax=Mesorhizobium TaxID=68287 RepID=UPI0010110DBB|nr:MULTISPECIES: HAMP domain-containing sensor histidine kinase [Mesorhizobium]MBR2687934.1 PAS domain-containing sensor histidine kinase [Aquamicrobium sp.]QAZ46833.1 PAS domain-containing sensor histidine kinase [Mesorhizobium sp. Pch-S]
MARRMQRRFVGLMFAAPFLAASMAVVLVTARLGAGVTVATIFAVFGLSWFMALLVAATGRLVPSAGAALGLASVGLAGLIAAGGGLASPLLVLVLALPVEAFFVCGRRRSVGLGVIAAIATVALQFVLTPLLPVEAPAAWHWLFPVAWGLTLLPRMRGLALTSEEPAQEQARLEDVIDAVVLRIGLNGEVADASSQSRVLLKLAPELLSGSGLFDRVHLADRVAYLSALADMREGAVLRRVELRIRLPKGDTTDLGANHRPFLLELMRGGDDLVALLRANDETVDLREALDVARESAAGADVAKGRFLAAVSHELRTPLNAIIGFSDMLLNEIFGGFKDPRQKEYVELVRDSGQHLLAVVTSILDVSRIESGAYSAQPEPFRFVDAVEMCQSMMRIQAEAKHIKLTTQIPADAGEINADRRAVQQILINLTSNAIKFTPDGGAVSIGARRLGSRLHFWVSDTGIGIAEADLCNLGKPFMQIQNDYTRRFEGTGLGLSLVKGLVSLHDGTMSIESAPGEGTKVTISLPIDGPKGGASKPTVLPLAQPRNEKEAGLGPLRKTA